MTLTEAPATRNVIERTRRKCGLARMQMLRAIKGEGKYYLFDRADQELDSIYYNRAERVGALFDIWTAGFMAHAKARPLDTWDLARLVGTTPWQITRWRVAGFLKTDKTEPRGQNHQATNLYGREEVQALIDANSRATVEKIQRSGPLAPFFLKFLENQ